MNPGAGAERPRRLPERTISARLRGRARALLGRPPVDFFDVGDALTMGRHSYGSPMVRWYYGDVGRVVVGHFTSIADDVVMTVGGSHPTSWVSTFPFRAVFGLPGAYVDGNPVPASDTEVGSDVYIGRGARILAGVRIGDGAVVGAYAVVAGDVRPYAVVVGNPAREVSRRFSDAQIDALLRIRWWAWPDREIMREVDQLNSGAVDEFIARHDPDPQG